ncbi:hypothetical protein HPB49_020467 [Dermacentor silvarum]|uniref:Uncharacterized protein n=1 Tax=Dermacentor silvarum TaxID=543639 RepID=A0ACB8DKG0_DERSI|nr:hypothetical protein HPB49_020467 [Dermacentor silvarum]
MGRTRTICVVERAEAFGLRDGAGGQQGGSPFSASADVDTIAPLSPNSPLTTGLSAQAARERGDADNNEDDWEVARARKEAGGRGDDAGVVGEPVIVEGPRNRTVVLGSSVTLPCVVEPSPSSSGGTAGATSVLWLQDGRSLASQGSSPWRQLDTGALLLHRVDVADAGSYRCSARNAHGVAYSETAQLVVHGER